VKRLILFALAGLVIVGSVVVFLRVRAHRGAQKTFAKLDADIPVVSTRGHLKGGSLTPGHTAYDYSIEQSGSQKLSEKCPGDLIVIIHGFTNTADRAEARFGVARQALVANGYKGLVVGFSWDANTQFQRGNFTGYRSAEADAILNAKKLAQFVFDIKKRCPKAHVRLLGFSMGARVALATVQELAENQRFASPWKVDSVHLLGAGVGNFEIQTNRAYGKDIEKKVGSLFNYYSPRDDMLGTFFPHFEHDRALGQTDILDRKLAPRNYHSINAGAKLVRVSSKTGRPKSPETGENHSGYLGTRNNSGVLIDDGAMALVAHDIESTKRSSLS